MEQSKVDNFLMMNSKYFEAYHFEYIREKLTALDDSKSGYLYSVPFKDPTNMLIISLLAGGFGVDRFLLGDTTMGVLKLITLGGCGVWSIIDLFLIMGKTKEYNFEQLNNVLLR
ncbi:MAG: TM2 domain-containing protein [Flavobacterium sp.]|nr:TM2 domain-containing protein [Candidatus Neoflavobacterium equi]